MLQPESSENIVFEGRPAELRTIYDLFINNVRVRIIAGILYGMFAGISTLLVLVLFISIVLNFTGRCHKCPDGEGKKVGYKHDKYIMCQLNNETHHIYINDNEDRVIDVWCTVLYVYVISIPVALMICICGLAWCVLFPYLTDLTIHIYTYFPNLIRDVFEWFTISLCRKYAKFEDEKTTE